MDSWKKNTGRKEKKRMTKSKKIFFLCLSLCLLFFVSSSGIALAAGLKLQDTSSLLTEKYNIDSFNSYMSSGEGFWTLFNGEALVNGIAGFSNILFELTKILFAVFDKAIEILYTMNVLEKMNSVVASLSSNLWLTFKASYLPLIVVLAILVVVRTYFIESSKQAFIQFGKIIVVLVAAGIWFSNSGEYLNKMNDYSSVIQADILSTAGKVDETADIAAGGEWLEDADGKPQKVYNEGTQELATNMIRNELFRQTVYNPFLLLNYGTTDKEEIQKIYDKVDGAEEIPKGNDGTYLLSKDFTELKADQKKDKIEALSKENTYMTVDKVGYKFIMSLISVLGTIFYGVPITAIAFLNVLLQLMAIVYSYILPIVAILSVFPKFSNGFTSSLINIAKIFIGKGLLGLVVLMFSLTNLTIDLLIAPSGFVTALLNLGVKITIYILVWKNRGKIVETITRAMVMQKTGVYLPQMVNRTSNQQQTAPYPYPMTNQAQDFVEERTIQESVSQEPHHMDYYEPTPHSEANDEEAKATKAAVSETIPIDELPVEDTPNELPVEEPLYEIPIKDISFENMPTEELPVEDFSDHVSMEEPPLGEFSVEETDIESLEMNEPPTIEHELTEKHVNETSEKTNDQQITNEPRQPVVNFSQQEIQNPTMNFYQENQIEEKLIQQEDFHDRLAELRG
ncbi:hypothetical protein HMPREF0345_2679 [Enterococcus faecalis ATCC 29200]|nr:hypothetical protein HMPREF0345_2679 [Enterococcus faecalis ATCC 29200]